MPLDVLRDSSGNEVEAFECVAAEYPTGFRVMHKQHDGTLIATIRPENLQFTLNKKQPHTIQYEYSHAQGVSPDFVGAYRTDFELWYYDTPIMAGMHTKAPQVVREEGFTTIAGQDWKHYLERRHYPFNYGTVINNFAEVNDYQEGGSPQGYAFYYTDTDVTVIAKKLLDVTLSRPYSLDLRYPTLTTALGIPASFGMPLADTQDILSYIDGLSDIDPGFDYEIDFYKELRFFSPRKYDTAVWDDPTLAVYEFSEAAGTLDYVTQGPTFVNDGPIATHWNAGAAGKTGTRVGASLGYEASQAVYRRLDGTADYGDVVNRTVALQRAMHDFSFALNPAHEIEMTVITNRINNFFVLFLPGYPIWLDAVLGSSGGSYSHRIQSAQELVMVDCKVTNEGECEATLGLNQIYEGTAGVNQG